MKTIVDKHLCYKDAGSVTVYLQTGIKTKRKMPKLFIMEAEIAARNQNVRRRKVSALLDTGNDITIVNPKIVKDLEKDLGFQLPVEKSIFHYDDISEDILQPCYSLSIIFQGDHSYESEHGFIAPSPWNRDVADLYLGQDIFSQLIVTFDGVEGTVTIIDPIKIEE